MGNETASRTGLLRRLGPAVASGALGLVLLTGCAAGKHAQTVEQTPAIDGVQAQAGMIAIRAAGIAAPESGTSYAKGSDAELRMVLVNQGAQPDKLVSVSSPAATGAELSAGSGSGSASPAASDSASSSPSASPSATSSASATSSGSASASPSSASASTSAASTPLDLPARQALQVGISDGDATVTLTGLNAELFSSQPIPVTLTFASGTSVTVTMAVQLTSEAPAAPTVSVATQHGE